MNIKGPIIFDIHKIYTLIHKKEEAGFRFLCGARAWDGFVVITEGECIFRTENRDDTVLRKSDVVFLKRGEKYEIRADGPIAYYTSAFDFSPDSEEILTLLPKASVCSGWQMKTIEQMTDSWQSQSSESYVFCKIRLLKMYYDILESETEELSYKDDAVGRAVKFLHNNFKRKFTSAALAEHCSLSESHLRKKFLRETNMTIWEYRDMLRFRLAKELLASGLFNIKEASYELGFCDVYYFTKFFRRYAGVSPGKFINSQSNNGL